MQLPHKLATSCKNTFWFFLWLWASTAWSQKHEAGLSLGMMNYRGEISVGILNITSPSYGVSAFYRFNLPYKPWSFRANFVFGEIKDSDAGASSSFARQRNHSFATTMIELSAVAEYNFLDMGRDIKAEYRWTPYIFGGIGYLKFAPKQNIQPNYSTDQVVIPFGVGAKFAINKTLNLGAEFGARLTFTDLLDDVGVNVFGPTVRAGGRDPRFFTGNPNDFDMYFYTGFKISYVFPAPYIACPVKIPD